MTGSEIPGMLACLSHRLMRVGIGHLHRLAVRRVQGVRLVYHDRTMSARSIGSYQLLEELGRGATGVVFRGFDPAVGRPVAIKIIRTDQLASPEEISELKVRFAREAAAAGKLSHPNIVTIHYLGEEGDLRYLVMELVQGSSLEKILSNGGQPQDEKTAVSIISQVAHSLDYAHSEGIVHRDVKPANILVQPDGKAKITDFGIARIVSQTITRTGFTLGTPVYMSPEQIMTAKVSGRADQYSLGVIAYQMLSGRRPFDADTGPGLMFQILQKQPPLLHSVNPAISPGASEVVAKAMAKNPEDRFASCQEFAERLSESLNEARVGTRDPNTEETATMPAVPLQIANRTRTRMSRVGLWIAVALAVVGLAVVGWFWSHRAVRRAGGSNVGPNGEIVAPSEQAKWMRPAGTTKVNPKDGLTYVWIPPGTFQMGCSPGDHECFGEEKPAHQVTISRGFWMGQTEVTQAAWRRVMSANPSHFQGANLPVENISWNDAQGYCGAAGLRLPTEAEWEYAARAGGTGSGFGDIAGIAWFDGYSEGRTHDVGGKKANQWGLHDMFGNVWEWVADWFAGSYTSGSATDPQGPASGTKRVLKGGAWNGNPRDARASGRDSYAPDTRANVFGVRCAGNF